MGRDISDTSSGDTFEAADESEAVAATFQEDSSLLVPETHHTDSSQGRIMNDDECDETRILESSSTTAITEPSSKTTAANAFVVATEEPPVANAVAVTEVQAETETPSEEGSSSAAVPPPQTSLTTRTTTATHNTATSASAATVPNNMPEPPASIRQLEEKMATLSATAVTAASPATAATNMPDELPVSTRRLEEKMTRVDASDSQPGAFACIRGNAPVPIVAASNASVIASGVDQEETQHQHQQQQVEEEAIVVAPIESQIDDSNNSRADNVNSNDVNRLSLDLPIAAELSPDHDALREEMEAQLRHEFEQRMSHVMTSATTVASLRIETVEFDESCAFGLDTAHSSSSTNHDNDDHIGDAANSDGISVEQVHPQQLQQQTRRGAHKDASKSTLRQSIQNNRVAILFVTLFLLAVIGISVGVTLTRGFNHQDDKHQGSNHANERQLPVLQAVRERGVLRCKPESLEGEIGEGFTIDLCRAIAAAIFGKDYSSRLELPYFPFKEHFDAVHRGELDLSTSQVSLNMGRDVNEQNSRTGYTYSIPYLYTGTALAGVPNFVDCAEKAEAFANDCRSLQVCVMINTVTQDIVNAHVPGSATKLVESHGDLFEQFANGTCNVIAGDTVNIYEQRLRDVGYTGEYKFAQKLLSHEHLAIVTREDDPHWSDFCNWVLHALISAEALNITQETAQTFNKTKLFGPEYEDMFIDAIAAVGNYGEMYERNYGGTLPRSRYNMINTGDSGLIVSDPLGTILVDEESLHVEDLPIPIPNGTMEAVINRGYLLCGVILRVDNFDERPGFAQYNRTTQEWSGLDVDYCRGLAASVSGVWQPIDTAFVDLSDKRTRYVSLANKTVDVLAGDRVSLTTDVREPTTGKGFSFGTPYFYYETTGEAGGGGGGARAFVTREDDQQWSDLAKWITQATFYAEEKGITQRTASEMPLVELFGLPFKQMFRDAIHATGNYGEMYQRNVQAHIPRTGRNQLNVQDNAQFYPIVFD